jgi:hypothetical protein
MAHEVKMLKGYVVRTEFEVTAEGMLRRSRNNVKPNETYGQLRVIEPIGCLVRPYGRLKIIGVECTCGTKIGVPEIYLKRGSIVSCGCANPEGYRPPFLGDIAAKNCVLYTYKRNAKKRGLDWRISKQDFFRLISSRCFYCGALSSMSMRRGRAGAKQASELLYNGVDRIDSSEGYVLGNVVPCCKHCNIAKGTKSCEEFFEWIDRIAANKPKVMF